MRYPQIAWTAPRCCLGFGGMINKLSPNPQLVLTRVEQPNTLGYAFDDGPNCSHNAFYDYLHSQNQKASAFMTIVDMLDALLWPRLNGSDVLHWKQCPRLAIGGSTWTC
jgi:hypothetical protein